MRYYLIVLSALLCGILALCEPQTAHAAIQYTNQRCAAGNNATTSGNTITCTINDSLGWSHTVSVFWCDASGCITTSTSGDTVAISDSQGNSYGSADVRLNSASGTDRRALAIIHANNIGANAANVVTATVTSSNTVFGLAIFVSAWIVPSHALILDQTCAASCLDAAATTSPASVSTSSATTGISDLVYALFNLDGGTLTAGGSYVAINQFTAAQKDEYLVVSTQAVQTATMTYTGTQQQRAVIVTFKENPLSAGTYFMSVSGNDGNSGTSAGSPWLTPNHYMTCGSTIVAAASTSYLASTFTSGNWGTVSCPASNDIVWVKCVTFDACKITDGTGTGGFNIDQSYWGVQGWEVTETANTAAGCFLAVPNFATQIPVHHNIFANDVANGCYSGGFGVGLSSTGSADYEAIIGNIAYDAAKGSHCYSNINVLSPYNFDTKPGTHIYVAGNFSWHAFNTANCNGGFPATDGEGVNLDTLDGIENGVAAYNEQVAVENNILIGNGGRGLEVERNNNSCTPCASVYWLYNTQWGNAADASETTVYCGEQLIYNALNITSEWNLVQTNAANGCTGNPLYAYQVFGADGSSHVHHTWGYSAAGNNTSATSSVGFSFGPNNQLGTDALFSNATIPGAPTCGSFADVPHCAATIIANFTPTNATAKAYGRQPVSTTSQFDPLYPQWLCTVTNIPSGLVTPGCLNASSAMNATLTGGVLH